MPPARKDVGPTSKRDELDRCSELLQAGKLEEALAALDSYIESNPDNATAHYYRGYALFALERYEEAIRACDAATELDPSMVGAYLNKGAALDFLSGTRRRWRPSRN